MIISFFIITSLIITLYCVLILKYYNAWNKNIYFKSENKINNKEISISVIIVARNEEENISLCLNNIINQNYDKNLFDIIVVNDNSTDNTVDEISKLLTKGNIKLINLPETEKGKKAGIELAIKSSNSKLIITTDADCIVPQNWLNEIAVFYNIDEPKMIIAPVVLSYKNNIFEKFQALEFYSLIGTTASTAFLNAPIMCNGANLIYERSVFNELGGFDNNKNIFSGDDVFFMFKLNEHYPNSIKFLNSINATVKTNACDNISDFINQRIRWASKTKYYNNFNIFYTGFIVLFINIILLLIIYF